MTDIELWALILRIDPRAQRIPPGIRKIVDAVITIERERCAKICDDEATRRELREENPLPGDTPTIQAHKAITARLLAMRIRGK